MVIDRSLFSLFDCFDHRLWLSERNILCMNLFRSLAPLVSHYRNGSIYKLPDSTQREQKLIWTINFGFKILCLHFFGQEGLGENKIDLY